LEIQRFGNGVGIGWIPFDLGQVLQCATRVSGPYWDVPGAAFPFYVTPITSTNRFYRVRHPFPQDNRAADAKTTLSAP
jgi:hypothetical protein